MTHKCVEFPLSPPQHSHNYSILHLKFLVKNKISTGAIATHTPGLPPADIFLFPELNQFKRTSICIQRRNKRKDTTASNPNLFKIIYGIFRIMF